jgi:hypothetical protein
MKLKSLPFSHRDLFFRHGKNKPLMQTQTGGAGVNLDTSKAKKPAGITDKVKVVKDRWFLLYAGYATECAIVCQKKSTG